MGEIYTSTLKYFWLAIERFLPVLVDLEKSVSNRDDKEDISDLIEIYREIQSQIDKHKFNYTDPSRYYDGEPHEVTNWLKDGMIENLSRLTLRLLDSWVEEEKKLKKKAHLTEKNQKRMYELQGLIRNLKPLSESESFLIGKYANKGPLLFPGEGTLIPSDVETVIENKNGDIFPKILIAKIPSDIARLCNEFNFNYRHKKPNAGILLLRRILPLAIVRKFQSIGEEEKVRNGKGEFLDTQALLGKVEGLLSQNRIYKEINTYKSLLDSSQHSYSLNVDISDTEGAAVKMRILLDDLF